MIGTQIVSNPMLVAYAVMLTTTVTGIAIYDLHKKRVPNKALAFCAPIFLVAPVVPSGNLFAGTLNGGIFAEQLLLSFLGGTLGLGTLLCAALFSKGGRGIGGGDIKLMGLLGFSLGPYGVMETLLIASVLCFPAALLYRWRKKTAPLSLPFVPFLALGCSATFVFQILR